MSQRIGMADGRCITDVTADRILIDTLKMKMGIGAYDNSSFRLKLQQMSPEDLKIPLCNAACRIGCEGQAIYSPLAENQ
jgi:hypothetical protein